MDDGLSALNLFYQGLTQDLLIKFTICIHLLETCVLSFQLLETLHQRRFHAAILAAPLIESGLAYAMSSTKVSSAETVL